MVVEVPLRVEQVEFLFQDGSGEFFRRCFSVRSSNTDDRSAECLSVFASQLLQSLQCVFHEEDTLVVGDTRFVDDSVGAALFDGLFSEEVAVEFLTL